MHAFTEWDATKTVLSKLLSCACSDDQLLVSTSDSHHPIGVHVALAVKRFSIEAKNFSVSLHGWCLGQPRAQSIPGGLSRALSPLWSQPSLSIVELFFSVMS